MLYDWRLKIFKSDLSETAVFWSFPWITCLMSSGVIPMTQTVHEFAVWFTAVSALEKVLEKTQTSVQSAHSVQSGVRGSVTFLHAVMEPPGYFPAGAGAALLRFRTWYIRGDSKLLFVLKHKGSAFSESSAYSERKRSTMGFMQNHLFRLSWTLQSFCWHWCLFPCWFCTFVFGGTTMTYSILNIKLWPSYTDCGWTHLHDF